MLLIVIDYAKLKCELMVVLSDIKLVWLLEILLSKRELIIQKYLVLWLKPLQFG
jgi:hypothetical protein